MEDTDAGLACDNSTSAVSASGILVLGANGFAGAAITARLAQAGRPVLAYGRSPVASPGVEPIQGTIEDSMLLRDAVARSSHIVYAASLTTPGTSAHDPALEVIGNLLPLARVLECAENYPERRLIHLSSGGAVYGDLADGASEASALRPRSYYGAGKVAAEAMIHACTATTTWTACVLRPSNLYGPGQATARGFAIVPTLFARAIDGKPFEVWGDGLTVRDYLYIDDLVEAVTAALPRESSQRFAAYNVASGCAVSIIDLVEACERTCGRRIALSFRPARGVDVARVALDTTMIAELGWRARVDLHEGLSRTWRRLEASWAMAHAVEGNHAK